jgi:hypothetical protein
MGRGFKELGVFTGVLSRTEMAAPSLAWAKLEAA